MRADIIRVDLERLVVILQRGVEVTLCQIDVAAAGHRIDRRGRVGQRHVAIRERLLELPDLGIGEATVGRDLRSVGIDLFCLGEIGERRVVLLAVGLYAPPVEAVIVAAGVVVREPDGGIEFVEGTLQVALTHENKRTVVVGAREVRLQFRALRVVGQRPLVLTLAAIGEAAHVEVSGVIGNEVDRRGIGHDRAVIVALFDQRLAANSESACPGFGRHLVVGNDRFAGGQSCDRFRILVPAGVDIAGRPRASGGDKGDEDQENGAQHWQDAPAH